MVPLRVVTLLAGLAMSNAALAAVTPAQSALLHELHECLRDVASHKPASAQPAYVSPCRMRDVSILVGVSRSDLLGALGQPGFCTGPKNQIALWSDPMCRAPVGFGYSFYRLCEDCVGGGPELLIQFDSAGATSLLRWVATQ